ncbi:MAG: hypothetical protein IT375_20310 [Polyangiaceae bacterium]|nr:hypothetical protein [Polyangiaceae bacterium]
MADKTDLAVSLALASTAGRELLCAIAENPRTRRAAELFAASLLTATSAAAVEQSGPVPRIGTK